jgi:hypothetical protein
MFTLAAEKSALSGQADSELEKRVENLEVAIAAKADNDALSALGAEVKSGYARSAAANNELRSTVSVALKVTEAPDVASFTVDTTKLEALRDLDGLGAFRKLDYETLKKLEGVGKIPGLTLNSIPNDVKKR